MIEKFPMDLDRDFQKTEEVERTNANKELVDGTTGIEISCACFACPVICMVNML